MTRIDEWNNTQKYFSAESNIVNLLDGAAAAHPDNAAVRTTAGVALTHGELAAASSGLARRISAIGIMPRTPVGLLADHVPEAVTAIHAVVRLGAFYVPLDPRWPRDRMIEVLRSVDIRYVLTTECYSAMALKVFEDTTVAEIGADNDCTVLRSFSGETRSWRTDSRYADVGSPRPEDLAYAVFTSGSTGQPKAVAVRHTSVVNLIEWFNTRNAISCADILLQVAAFSFDLSVYDIFGVLAAGASILLIPGADLDEPEEIAIVLVGNEVTLWNSAPAMFTVVTQLLSDSPRARRDVLRRVFLSGDWIPMTTFDLLRREFPHATLVALGGATEACVWSNDFVVEKVDPSWRSIPYGYPMQNSRYYVLREDLSPCDIDEAGELYIAGVCVAAGYLNDPELSSARFTKDRWGRGEDYSMYRTGDRARWTCHGWIEFLGRVDSQVKIRGYRIELGEIEYAARQIPHVEEAIALSVGDPRSPDLAIAIRATEDVDRRAVEKKLSEWLPTYMLPTHVVTFRSFPVGATGKVDRTILRTLLTGDI
jgi:amino acid adenylation domain-containing protein